MAQVTLNPTADTRIRSDQPTTNEGGSGTWEVGKFNALNSVSRGLMKFDLSSIPSTITSVTLRIYDDGTDLGSNTRTLRIYRSKRAWTELGATWNTYDGSNNWTTAGSGDTTNDYDNTEVGNVSMPGTEVVGWNDITLDATLVEAMRTGSFTNNGFFAKMDTEILLN